MKMNNVDDGFALLDLFSTSQTEMCFSSLETTQKVEAKCQYRAPHFAYQVTGRTYALVQGCCNHWDCVRCGLMRARAEYGRIVGGCRQIASSHAISFITVTCRGKDLSRQEADDGYALWTNRFLTAARARAKRKGQDWYYVQVTERQKRGHPHSHILSAFDPGDIEQVFKTRWTTGKMGERVYETTNALSSRWIAKEVVSCGLGKEYDISFVETVEGASRYVAKYLFKESIFRGDWPKSWKRVRYSHSFPKLPKRTTNAIVLVRARDWYDVAVEADTLICRDAWAANFASEALQPYPVRVKLVA